VMRWGLLNLVPQYRWLKNVVESWRDVETGDYMFKVMEDNLRRNE